MRFAFICMLTLVSAVSFAQSGPLHFPKAGLSAELSWLHGPKTGVESILRMDWKNLVSQHSAEPGSFKVVLWMPDMGHGSSPTRLQRVLGADSQPLVGAYRVTNIYFTMGGVWDVHVSVKLVDGSEETQSIRLTLPGGGHGGHH